MLFSLFLADKRRFRDRTSQTFMHTFHYFPSFLDVDRWVGVKRVTFGSGRARAPLARPALLKLVTRNFPTANPLTELPFPSASPPPHRRRRQFSRSYSYSTSTRAFTGVWTTRSLGLHPTHGDWEFDPWDAWGNSGIWVR